MLDMNGFGTEILREGWKFAVNPAGDPSAVDYNDSSWKKITLPHDWQIERRREENAGTMQGFYPLEGIGWYRLALDADAEQSKLVTRLIFDGVQRFYTVYVNGVEAGKKNYGYVPYWCEISLKEGRNIIAVKVDNNKVIDGDYYTDAHPRDRWYSGEGIYRTVELDRRGALHILPYGIRAEYTLGENADVKLLLSLDNRTVRDEVKARAIVTAPNGESFIAACALIPIRQGKCSVELPFTLKNPELWDIDSPKLYKIRVELFDGDEILDANETRTGFRTSVFDPDKGYLLNGRVVKMAGVDLHHDYGAFGAAIQPDVLRRRLERLKSIGCNAIRCSHNPKEREFYDMADEMGFLVIDELYDKWRHSYYKMFIFEDWQDDMDAWMARDYNHPCVIVWSVGNECKQFPEDFFEDLQMFVDGVHARDNTRPATYALIGYGEHDFSDPKVYHDYIDPTLRYAKIVDVFMGNYMENFYRALRKEGMRRCIIGSEVFEYYRLAELSNSEIIDQNPWNDVEELPYVVGGFIWAGIDYLGESITWPSHGWTGCPIDSVGMVKLRGEYTKSLWTDEPMVKIAVFDERDPYDGTRGRWGFPQMVSDWYYPRNYHLQHVGIYTNCDTVTLSINDGLPRTAKPDPANRMAHFLLCYIPGKIEAKGYRDGVEVASQTLYSSEQAERIELSIYESHVKADGYSIFHAEATLVDKYGQVFIRERPKVRFIVEGADIAAVDNGDFNTTDEIPFTDTRTFWNGQVVAYLRTHKNPGKVKVTAIAEGFVPVSAEIETE